ncbi:MAG: TldD/PmbA family protein [Clostridia bacterium]|nr:TldD/PmbA family protein [Clostridia bacterium]
MADIKNIVSQLKSLLTASGVEKYAVSVAETEKRELNTEGTNFNLYRTTFGKRVSVTAFIGGKKGSSSGNDFTPEGLEKVVKTAAQGANSSPEDPANDIAAYQEPAVFKTGTYEPDMDAFYLRLKELTDTVSAKHPKIKIMALIASHDKGHSLYANSNGTEFEDYSGIYSAVLEFAGNDGEKTTGLAYDGVIMGDLAKPVYTLGNIAKTLADTENSLNPISVGGKFEGDIILTPAALGEFGMMLVGNYISAGVIMDGTSLWKDKLGQKVASDSLTVRAQAQDSRIVACQKHTGDGYAAENVTLIEKGVLKSFMLNLYAANKTGLSVTKNDGGAFVIDEGDTPVADMIASVKRGLIVGGFSGGQPGANGEFSGVAKNSFYVEDGKIKGAVMETMISGNLEAVFANVKAISKEQVLDGNSALPYLQTGGITISGN